MYRVLRVRLEKTDERDEDGKTIYRVRELEELGFAYGWADAYAKFPRGRKNGYSHVLEACPTSSTCH